MYLETKPEHQSTISLELHVLEFRMLMVWTDHPCGWKVRTYMNMNVERIDVQVRLELRILVV